MAAKKQVKRGPKPGPPSWRLSVRFTLAQKAAIEAEAIAQDRNLNQQVRWKLFGGKA
jgi:hypothetical protein